MHGTDLLKYGHTFLVDALDGLDERHYNNAAICGVWTVKDVIAHLASTELRFVDILHKVLEIEVATPTFDAMFKLGSAFNDAEVDKRKAMSYQAVWDEYDKAQQKVAELWKQVPREKQQQTGLLDWYGSEYDLEDFLVYTSYAHKREHGAEINVLKDTVK
jgi:uncharacterized damage-inducible protein DinB